MAKNRLRCVENSACEQTNAERRAAARALLGQDHRRLAERAGGLAVAIEAGAGRAMTRECIEGVIAAARDHFVNEEWAMRTINAPDYQAHKAEHGRLLRDAADMLKNFDTAFGPGDWPALASYFRHWIGAHYRRYDDALLTRLRSGGDAGPPAA